MKTPKFYLSISTLICLLSQSAPILEAQVPQSKREPATLITLGQSTERELAGGHSHEYQLKLNAGEFVQVRVEQMGVDVLVTCYSADGSSLATMDSPNGKEGLEILSWVAGRAGTYQLEVQPLDADAPPGKYSILLSARRVATPADRAFVPAERLFAEANALRALRTSDSSANALKKYELALPILRDFKDEYRARLTEGAISAIKRDEAIARRKAKSEAYGNVPQLVVATGHANLVSSVAFSPVGRLLASGSHDDTIKLWDIDSGKELNTLTGHSAFVWSVAFSPNGRMLASGSKDMFGNTADNSIKLWDVRKGQVLKTLARHSSGIRSVAFSPNGAPLASASGDTVKLWDVERGEELRALTVPSSGVQSVAFSLDGKMLAAGGDKTTTLWDITTGAKMYTLVGHADSVQSVAFDPKGKILATASWDKTIKLWDVASGRELRTLTGHLDLVNSVAFAPDGKVVTSGSSDGTVKLWDVASGKELRTLAGHSSEIDSVAFSADGKTLASGSSDTTVKLWDPATGKELKTLARHSASVNSVEFSPDRKVLASSNGDQTIKLWDIANGTGVKTLAGHSSSVWSIAFSPSGKILATGSRDQTIKLWDVSTGLELRTLKGHSDSVNSVAFSRDGKTLASGGWDRTIRLWDVATGKQSKVLDNRFSIVNTVSFSANGSTLASGGNDGEIKLWDLTGLQKDPILLGKHEFARSVAFSSDGAVLMSAGGWSSATYKLWDLRAGRELSSPEDWAHWDGKFVDRVATFNGNRIRAELDGNKILLVDDATEDDLATLIAVDQNEWVLVDPDGRFDASPGAERLMYYVLNTPQVNYEVIDFDQLKLRYYEPGLLQKIFKGEPLRDVSAFRDVRLTPDVQEVGASSQNPFSAKRTIKLTNRGGGIGRVQVFVNDREFIEDARDRKLKQNPEVKEAFATFDLTGASVIPGEQPRVKVIAWNYDPEARDEYKGYISSRGTELVYTPPPNDASKPATKPELYAIIGGISDYDGDKLDLRFAAKDAEDIAKAITVGGKNLFGVERLHVTLLATSDYPGAIAPTKENFQKAFAAYAKQAKPEDIFLAYLSGHGITLGHGSDTYLYLTKDANTTDVDQLKRDSDLLARATISSDELKRWFKSVNALKQVLILDTCAAGAAVAKLSSGAKDVQTDAIRAIDQMQDVTGFHVLMGSAADAVSYEATQYGQGLLTYSLLQGIKSGEALEESGRVDVSRLFQYAANKVPQLALNIGGIQRPQIRGPSGDSKSFALGLISSVADKREIPLATPKPLIMRPVLQNQKLGYDNLKLTPLLRDALREASYATVRGRDAGPLVFVDAEEMPDAIIPSGNYTIEGENVRVTLNLVRNEEVLKSFTVEGQRNDLAGLVKKLIADLADGAR